ncbi:MAG: hypothetical protein JXR91_11410 [Deltaproteobacteria bacterium]|nr:hypothetical protein [Deltaproteobacteria bacterium]
MYEQRKISFEEKQFILNQIIKVKKSNRAYALAFLLLGVAFIAAGIVLIIKGSDHSLLYIFGGVAIILGVPLSLSAISYLRNISDDEPPNFSMYVMNGVVEKKIIHQPKGGSTYEFYLDNQLLYLPNSAWENVFRKFDNTYAVIDAFKVPYSYRKPGNMGRAEYVVAGIYDYKEYNNRDSEIYTVNIKRLSLIFTLFVISLMFVLPIWGGEFASLCSFTYRSPGLTGNFQLIPSIIANIYLIGVIASLGKLIQGAIIYGKASSKIEREIEAEIEKHKG